MVKSLESALGGRLDTIFEGFGGRIRSAVAARETSAKRAAKRPQQRANPRSFEAAMPPVEFSA
jgi:hypothetical protein